MLPTAAIGGESSEAGLNTRPMIGAYGFDGWSTRPIMRSSGRGQSAPLSFAGHCDEG
ncbi:MAG: hypothetical protein WCN95_14225 [bacterium]